MLNTRCTIVDLGRIPVTAIVTIARVSRTVIAIAVAIVIIIGLLVAVTQVGTEITTAMVVEVIRAYDTAPSRITVIRGITVIVEATGIM